MKKIENRKRSISRKIGEKKSKNESPIFSQSCQTSRCFFQTKTMTKILFHIDEVLWNLLEPKRHFERDKRPKLFFKEEVRKNHFHAYYKAKTTFCKRQMPKDIFVTNVNIEGSESIIWSYFSSNDLVIGPLLALGGGAKKPLSSVWGRRKAHAQTVPETTHSMCKLWGILLKQYFFLTKLYVWLYHPSITFQNLFFKEIVFRRPIWNKRQKIIFQTLWQLKTYLFSKAFKRSELIFKCIHVWFKNNFGKDEC